ncbi:alanine racemase C-terminal domain-containing protein [Paenarthrobacter nitroguajacolicus]|uniref:alanine racemase C-terminal domain-containing protein n=1 Tax=Paenarthrobacter nitroguajacolicus TaxID=211146 RepID=UPI00142EA015
MGGLPQHLDAAARVMINNRPCRIVGPVNMDQIVVESGSWAASLGTEATLIGVNPRAHSAGLGPLGEHIGT